jgi:hypothetical protein
MNYLQVVQLFRRTPRRAGLSSLARPALIKHKVGLLNLAAELGNVSRACKVMGFSRDTFHRYKAAVADGGVEVLLDANCKKPNFRNRIEESIETAVAAFALEQPGFGQVRVSNELRKRGIFVSPSGVRSVWMRRDLESFKTANRARKACGCNGRGTN